MKVRALLLSVSIVVAGPVSAGWFEDTLTNAAKRVAERGIDDAADGAYEAGKDAVTQEEENPKKESTRKQKGPTADEKASPGSGDEDVGEESEE